MSNGSAGNAKTFKDLNSLLDSLLTGAVGSALSDAKAFESAPSAFEDASYVSWLNGMGVDLGETNAEHVDEGWSDPDATVIVFADMTKQEFDLAMKSGFNVQARQAYYNEWMEAEEEAAESARQELSDWWAYVMEDTEFWHDKFRRAHYIPEMDTDYIRNVIGFLKRKADVIARHCVSAEDLEVMDVDHWLHSTNVMRALCDELLNR